VASIVAKRVPDDGVAPVDDHRTRREHVVVVQVVVLQRGCDARRVEFGARCGVRRQDGAQPRGLVGVESVGTARSGALGDQRGDDVGHARGAEVVEAEGEEAVDVRLGLALQGGVGREHRLEVLDRGAAAVRLAHRRSAVGHQREAEGGVPGERPRRRRESELSEGAQQPCLVARPVAVRLEPRDACRVGLEP
jgi:hypothetical protein